MRFPSLLPLRIPARLAAWRPNANFALRALIALIAVLLCWQSAGLLAQILGWQSSQPALVLPRPPASDTGAGRAALARWFTSTETGQPVSSTAGMQLIAVVAGKRGVALIGGIESTPVAVAIGKEARPGLRLVDVLADRAIFEQAGARSELAFPPEPLSITPAPASIPPVTPLAPKPVKAEAEVPKLSSKIARGQLAGVAQGGNLGDWDKGLANFAGGGIRVTSASTQPLAKVLNLRDGDIMKRVNDRDLTQLADISLIYHHFSQSQEVTLTILRDGKPQQLNFKIQP